jgi:hypothetical protein
MNDNIERLCKELLHYDDMIFGWRETVERFAEGIVRECISAVEEDTYDTYDEWLIGHAAGLRKAKELIAKHFGIEP